MPYDTYEPDFTFDDPASTETGFRQNVYRQQPLASPRGTSAGEIAGGMGLRPYRGGAIAAASTPPPSSPEDFLPQRDITPMGDPKFFRELDASGLNAAQRLRLQNEYFQGADQVQAYRDNLRQKEQQSMINDLRIAQAQETLAGIRRRQTAAQQANESRDEIARRVQEIRRTNADPAAQAEALAALETEYLPKVASDQTVSRMFDVARRGIPQPVPPTMDTKELVSVAAPIREAFDSAEYSAIMATGDEFVIRMKSEEAKARLAEQSAARSGDMQRRARLAQDHTRAITDLAMFPVRFMSDEERLERGVDWRKRDDKGNFVTQNGEEVILRNPNQYLDPESHNKMRELILRTKTYAEYQAFDAMTDEEKMDFMREYRVEAFKRAYEDANTVVDSLLNRETAEAQKFQAQAADLVPLSDRR
jgi:hypothetical protein